MSEAKVEDAHGGRGDTPRTGLMTFFRQVIAELRKVVWPTQKQLINYFWIVLFFVLVMMTIVSLLDLGFGRLVFWIFGGAS